MKIVLIRHFKTQGNLERRYIGSTDEPVLQGELPAGRDRYPAVEKIISSPMLRCIQTAKLIYGREPDLFCTDLAEKDFGRCEGKNFEELCTDPEYMRWLESGGTLPFPAGEPEDEFILRSRSGFETMTDLLLETGCKSAAFLVHGGTIMAILSGYAAEKKGFYDWQTENGNGYRIRLNEDAWKAGKKEIMEMEKLW